MFSKEQYSLVRKWIYRNARPLDLARWQYHFEGGTSSAVLEALKAYQNNDGGFGHGLEADCWNPKSSPLQTWWAIQFLKEVGLVVSSQSVVKEILRYLDSGDGTMDDGRWRFSVASNNDWPHAPWWTYVEGESEPGYNPSAALAGFILAKAEKEGRLYQKAQAMVIEGVQARIIGGEKLEMHELSSFIELDNDLISVASAVTDSVPVFLDRLKAMVNDTIERDSSKWLTEYCCKPSHFFIMPDSPFYEDNKELIEEEMALLCSTLSEDGTWPVTWAWGSYEKEFAVSSRWWQAHIIIQNMRLLKTYNKLSEIF